MTEENIQQVAGLASDLNRELEAFIKYANNLDIDTRLIEGKFENIHRTFFNVKTERDYWIWLAAKKDMTGLTERTLFAIEQIHEIAKDYFSDTCGESEEAGRILQIIGDLRRSI